MHPDKVDLGDTGGVIDPGCGGNGKTIDIVVSNQIVIAISTKARGFLDVQKLSR